VPEPSPSGHRKWVLRAVAGCADLALAVTCSGGATMTIDVSGGESIALSLSGEADPLAIVLTPSDPGCGGFDASTVTAIQVNGTGGGESVTIDQSGSAPFPHQSSTSIDLALGAGRTPSSSPDGAPPTRSSSEPMASAWMPAASQTSHRDRHGRKLHRRCRRGDDTVSGKGGGGLGGEFPTATTIHGEAGNDALTGGGGNDTSSGGTGSDTLRGETGATSSREAAGPTPSTAARGGTGSRAGPTATRSTAETATTR
jgi:Ca2+-binding RTX toxin-like protein